MTQHIFTKIGTKAIERGLADPHLSAFHEAMMSGPAPIADRLRDHLPYLSLCSDRMTDGAPPPIFYVGKRASQRTLFGDDWADPEAGSLRTPDIALEEASAEGYRVALGGTPYYGYGRTTMQLDGRRVEVAFERLIIALRPNPLSDRRFCAYFGVIQHLHRDK